MDDVVVAVVWGIVTVVLAGVATAVSLRLLGIGRGWTKGLAAGAAGWLIGGLVALGVSDWDWGADGLLLQAFAIAVPATMAAAVLLTPSRELAEKVQVDVGKQMEQRSRANVIAVSLQRRSGVVLASQAGSVTLRSARRTL